MTNQPLTSGEHIKVVIFTILFLPTIFLAGAGVIPAIFLVFGFFMMKKNEDFNHIAMAIKAFKWYTLLGSLIFICFSLYFGYELFAYDDNPSSYAWDKWMRYEHESQKMLLGALFPVIYFILVTQLLLKPLSNHRNWVEVNGIFSNKPKSPKANGQGSDVDIIKGETFKSYSVADELLKWAKLKDEGHISNEEYDDARKKLLNRG